ncbi:cell adhesion molecule CEACAM19 isoform X2 [Dasypus novemcinctus]|uniref:cell adhesion molecule CEACAM19 isoform X2 n=1 Tax=Dasypus novemcinctus TaxID=9361 RepID=UPI00265FFEC6|nr:carcinoembryonic antigen-related cell adhesion molecule 19 isoform X2 [Dasypus novemcinctus]
MSQSCATSMSHWWPPEHTRMDPLTGALGHFSRGLLLSASVLALWIPQDSWAALHIQKIPEQPQQNQDLLLSIEGIPGAFQDLNWYLGEETSGGTRLFSYIPGLQRPQRDGNAMGQRDIVGFSNGSMLLRRAQPTDSGTYQVAVTINPSWTLRAKTKVQVDKKHKEPPAAHLPLSAGLMAAVVVGSLAAGTLLVGSIAYVLVTRDRRGQSHRVSAPGGQGSLSVLYPAASPLPATPAGAWLTPAEKPELSLSPSAGDDNVYEVMPSPVLLVSPFSDTGSKGPAADLLNPDPAPYCQLVPTP